MWLLNAVWLYVNVVWWHFYILFRDTCRKGLLEKTRSWIVRYEIGKIEVGKFGLELEISGWGSKVQMNLESDWRSWKVLNELWKNQWSWKTTIKVRKVNGNWKILLNLERINEVGKLLLKLGRSMEVGKFSRS